MAQYKPLRAVKPGLPAPANTNAPPKPRIVWSNPNPPTPTNWRATTIPPSEYRTRINAYASGAVPGAAVRRMPRLSPAAVAFYAAMAATQAYQAARQAHNAGTPVRLNHPNYRFVGGQHQYFGVQGSSKAVQDIPLGADWRAGFVNPNGNPTANAAWVTILTSPSLPNYLVSLAADARWIDFGSPTSVRTTYIVSDYWVHNQINPRLAQVPRWSPNFLPSPYPEPQPGQYSAPAVRVSPRARTRATPRNIGITVSGPRSNPRVSVRRNIKNSRPPKGVRERKAVGPVAAIIMKAAEEIRDGRDLIEIIYNASDGRGHSTVVDKALYLMGGGISTVDGWQVLAALPSWALQERLGAIQGQVWQMFSRKAGRAVDWMPSWNF